VTVEFASSGGIRSICFIPGYSSDTAKATKLHQESFVPYFSHEEGYEMLVSSTGVEYDVTYNYTFFQGGVVGLASMSDVMSVQCLTQGEDGVIQVEIKGKFDCYDAEYIFPLDSMVVVPGDMYGPCDFLTSLLHNDTEAKIANEPEDGFLIIEQVSCFGENPTFIILSGSPSSFNFLFDEADITYEAIREDDRRSLATGLGFKTDKKIKHKSFRANVTVDAGIDPFVDSINFKVSLSDGLTWNIRYGYEAWFNLYLGLDCVGGTSFPLFSNSTLLVSIQALGLGPPVQTKWMKRLGINKGLGLYYNVPFIYEIGFELEKDYKIANYSYSTWTRKEYVYTLKGGWSGIKSSVTKVVDSSTNKTSELEGPSREVPNAFGLSLYLGLRPELELTAFGVIGA